MKRIKPALCALMSIYLLLCLNACGSLSPEQALSAAQEKLDAAGSLSCDISMDLSISALGESFDIKSSCRADITYEPTAIRLEVSTDMGGLGSSEYTAYAASAGGLYSAYIQLPGMWVRQDLSGAEAIEQYDVRASSRLWLSGLAEVTASGSEELDGRKALCYDCTVDSKAMDGIMSGSGAYETLSVLGLDEASAQEILSGLGEELPLRVWIGEEEGLPLRYELDLGGIMRALMDTISSAAGDSYTAISIDGLTVTMDLSNFDAVEPITIPPEALGARPLDGEEIF